MKIYIIKDPRLHDHAHNTCIFEGDACDTHLIVFFFNLAAGHTRQMVT